MTARDSGSLSCRVCGSESQERSGGQSQEAEGYGGGEEKEEDNGVLLVVPGQGARGRGCPIGES